MKLRFLLLISIFSSAAIFFLFSALLPSPSLAAATVKCYYEPGIPKCLFNGRDSTCPFSSEAVNECAAYNADQAACEAASLTCPTASPTPPLISPGNPLCGTDNTGVNTAIGCLMAGEPKVFVSQLLGWGVGVGGGIAFLMILLAGFQMVTASGDPKKVQAARELLMSAIGGLIIIVLSVVLLNFIGVSILNIENLGFHL